MSNALDRLRAKLGLDRSEAFVIGGEIVDLDEIVGAAVRAAQVARRSAGVSPVARRGVAQRGTDKVPLPDPGAPGGSVYQVIGPVRVVAQYANGYHEWESPGSVQISGVDNFKSTLPAGEFKYFSSNRSTGLTLEVDGVYQGTPDSVEIEGGTMPQRSRTFASRVTTGRTSTKPGIVAAIKKFFR